jgi:hypothetical protein
MTLAIVASPLPARSQGGEGTQAHCHPAESHEGVHVKAGDMKGDVRKAFMSDCLKNR